MPRMATGSLASGLSPVSAATPSAAGRRHRSASSGRRSWACAGPGQRHQENEDSLFMNRPALGPPSPNLSLATRHVTWATSTALSCPRPCRAASRSSFVIATDSTMRVQPRPRRVTPRSSRVATKAWVPRRVAGRGSQPTYGHEVGLVSRFVPSVSGSRREHRHRARARSAPPNPALQRTCCASR
jgi:hypothetical protein